MNAKKTSKKTAKKTFPRKKTVPKLKKMSAEEFFAVMAEIRAETDARIAKSREETDKAMRVSREETDKVIQALSERIARTTANVDRLSSDIGHLGKDIGELMEFIVIPKIRLAMNASGKHSFNIIQSDRTFRKIDDLGEKKALTEVDVLLFSDTEAMAVETKTYPTIRDVKKHRERLEILRQHEEMVGIKDKKLFGAIAGAVIDKDVKNFALENGLYLVKIREEEGKLEVSEPKTCQTW